jgi:addiction module RelE/StbE family toxin
VKRRLLQTKKFKRDLRSWLKAHPETAANIESALGRLSNDDADPSLKTHKLRGPLAGLSACSAGYDLRIVFEYVEENGVDAISLLTIGTHEEVY